MTRSDSAAAPEVAPARLPPHGRRILAFWVDLAAVGFPIVVLWAMGQLAGVGSIWLAVALLGASFVAYTAVSIWLTGGTTVGKAACGLAVRRADGSPVPTSARSLAWAVGRQSVGYVVVDVFGLGSLVAVVDNRRRALHDLGFASQVVAPADAAAVPVRRRLEKYSATVEAALDDPQREYRWLLFLWKWLTKIVLLMLMWLLAATRIGARVDQAPSPSPSLPAATGSTSLSPGATAAVWAATGALTLGAVTGGAALISDGEDTGPRPPTSSGSTSPSDPGPAVAGNAPAARVDDQLVGRWGVDLPPAEGDRYGDALLEIRVGPEPALFTGRQAADTAEASDCPVWGDLQLDQTADPSDPRLAAPSNSGMLAAWSGTVRSWCYGSPDLVSTVLVGLHPDGALVMTFPDEDPLTTLPGPPTNTGRTIFLSRRG